MRIDYDKLYELLSQNEEAIKDVLDTTKVFISLAAVHLAKTFGGRFYYLPEWANIAGDIVHSLTMVAGFVFVVYKIADIHYKHRIERKKNAEAKREIFRRKKGA